VSAREATSSYASDLKFNFDSSQYLASSDLNTKDTLGSLTFHYDLSTYIYPLGEIKFTVKDVKRVGYDIALTENVVSGDRTVQSGEAVVPGTKFNFGLELSTTSTPSFVSGGFVVDFKVLDASNVVKHTASLDGSSNDSPIAFDYVLTGDDLPSGDVSFVFEIRNERGLHTSKKVAYFFQQQMLATEVSFQPTLNLGETLEISMVPAYLKDNAAVAFSAGKRSFVVDLVSPKGQTFLSIDGSPSDDGSRYVFETQLPSTLDFIGTTYLSFRYVPAAGHLHSVTLQSSENADSQKFVVNSELHLSEVEDEPTSTDYVFGSVISFKFKIFDKLSETNVVAGKHSKVYLSTKFGQGEGSFESERVVADVSEEVFQLTQEIDANTAQGSATIQLQAVGVDGDAIQLLKADSNDEVKYNVMVGGEIQNTHQVFSTVASDSTKTAFIVSFTLSSQQKVLKGANLRATVLVKNRSDFATAHRYDQSLASIPVVFDQQSLYSLSFTLPHELAVSGDYKIKFVREVDVLRAKADKETVKSLFELSIPHRKVESGSLFIQMELAILLILGAMYLGVSSRSSLFENKKSA